MPHRSRTDRARRFPLPLPRCRRSRGRCRAQGGPIVRWASWWTQPEAVLRLSVCGAPGRPLRLEPASGMSNWWRFHFHPHMRVLLDGERVPSGACTRASINRAGQATCQSRSRQKTGRLHRYGVRPHCRDDDRIASRSAYACHGTTGAGVNWSRS